jgi:tRNA threonylcarbamoyladenosine biosynthesis protein TsaB
MAYILNIETSTEVCSVVLSCNGEILFEREMTEGLNHSRLLAVFIDQIFKESGLTLEIIDAVSVSMGPGSYTGLRIGISLAKGFCYALDKPLIAIGTLDAMGIYTAQNINKYFPEAAKMKNILCCPMIDARRMEVYTSLYDTTGKQLEKVSAKIIDRDSFSTYLGRNPVMFFGNGAAKCIPVLDHPNALFKGPVNTSARFMLKLSEDKYKNNDFEDVAYFEPFYLKDFIATVPVNKVIK